MKRRTFLTALASLGFLASRSLLSPLKMDASQQLSTSSYSPAYYLSSGEVFIAKEGLTIKLPSHPKDEDFVCIAIDGTSLKNPSVLSTENALIAGDREPLELDSLGNIKLVYKTSTNNWTLG